MSNGIDGPPRSGVWAEEPQRFDQKLPRCAYIYSHCDTISRRDEYVSELMRHFPVDAHGACLKNVQDDQAGVPLHYPPRFASLGFTCVWCNTRAVGMPAQNDAHDLSVSSCCLLHVVPSPSQVGRCMLHVACCMLNIVCCMFQVARCILYVASIMRLLPIACCTSHVAFLTGSETWDKGDQKLSHYSSARKIMSRYLVPAQMWAGPAQMWAVPTQMWVVPARMCAGVLFQVHVRPVV